MTSTDATIGGGFIVGDTTIPIDKPRTGIVRIAIMGDWTSAGRISADLQITEVRSEEDEETAKGKVEQSENDLLLIDIPAGTAQTTFDLAWKNNWGAYPTDDLDLILVDPTFSSVNFDGATLASPERVVIDNPTAGAWFAFIDGFTVHGVIDGKPYSKYELTVKADGEVVELDDSDDDDDDSDD